MNKKIVKALGAIAAGVTVVGAVAAVADQIEQKRHPSAHQPYGPYERYIKRPLDAVLALSAMAVLSPILLTVSALIKKDMGSPILFKQHRIGLNDKEFSMYKFRSMTDARDENGVYLPDDQRITKLGNFIRKTSIDELPSLLNILKGDMAIIGNRVLLGATRKIPEFSMVCGC